MINNFPSLNHSTIIMSQPHKINLNLPTAGEMNRHFFNASGNVGGTAGHSLSATGSIGGQYNFSNGAFAGGNAGENDEVCSRARAGAVWPRRTRQRQPRLQGHPHSEWVELRARGGDAVPPAEVRHGARARPGRRRPRAGHRQDQLAAPEHRHFGPQPPAVVHRHPPRARRLRQHCTGISGDHDGLPLQGAPLAAHQGPRQPGDSRKRH